VLLLPFCLVGPFAGVLLDRWSRQRILLVSNLIRAGGVVGLAALAATSSENVGFYVLALALLGVNRFILAGLSASLPHVVPLERLVAANSIAPTAGTVATVVGAGTGVVVRQVAGGDDFGTALALIAAASVWALAAGAATLFNRASLGPRRTPGVTSRRALLDVSRGVAEGIAHVRKRQPAARALLLMAGHRLLYGLATVMGILLFRNNFFADDLDLAFAGLGVAVVAAGAGVLVAAAVTPWSMRRWGTRGWMTMALLVSAVGQFVFGLSWRPDGLIAGSFLLGATAQVVKIGVDTILQRHVADRFRGRVFALSDLLFNGAYVAAACLAALLLPVDGRAPWMVVAISIGYVTLALWYSKSPRQQDTAESR
jgi:MFS family permease